MDSITRISQKIKENILERQNTSKVLQAFLVSMLIFTSFIVGRISILNQKNTNIADKQEVQIYLPDGNIYESKVSKEIISPLSGYILGTIPKTADIPESTVKERVSDTPEESQNTQKSSQNEETSIFASKTGKVYYVPNCKAGNRVKVENRIYFENEDHAQEEGFTKSKQCK